MINVLQPEILNSAIEAHNQAYQFGTERYNMQFDNLPDLLEEVRKCEATVMALQRHLCVLEQHAKTLSVVQADNRS